MYSGALLRVRLLSMLMCCMEPDYIKDQLQGSLKEFTRSGRDPYVEDFRNSQQGSRDP